MGSKYLPRIMIAGTNSGCGKTIITTAILAGFIKMNLKVQPYKCGPDYIDPMFHTFIAERESRNLDSHFCDNNLLKYIMLNGSSNADICIIEGVMGFYDGIGEGSKTSSYEISQITDTPVVLTVNIKGMARSVSAIIKGFKELEPHNNIKAVILNNCSKGMYNFYKKIIEKETHLEVVGYLPVMREAEIGSRHLGLRTTQEISDLNERINIITETALQTISFDRIRAIAESTNNISCEPIEINQIGKFKLGIAYDKAFNFYYKDNLEIFERLGAEIIKFSPMNDTEIPQNLDGIYWGGGYPEIYAKELSENRGFIESLKRLSEKNIPILAECGGFMYLVESIENINGTTTKMSALLKGRVKMTDKLNRFGYIQLISQNDNPISQKGGIIKGHEFHYSDCSDNGKEFEVQRPNGKKWFAFQSYKNIIAGYPHLYFYSNIKMAERFAERCCIYKNERSVYENGT